jgi:hypothetical protein
VHLFTVTQVHPALRHRYLVLPGLGRFNRILTKYDLSSTWGTSFLPSTIHPTTYWPPPPPSVVIAIIVISSFSLSVICLAYSPVAVPSSLLNPTISLSVSNRNSSHISRLRDKLDNTSHTHISPQEKTIILYYTNSPKSQPYKHYLL